VRQLIPKADPPIGPLDLERAPGKGKFFEQRAKLGCRQQL